MSSLAASQRNGFFHAVVAAASDHVLVAAVDVHPPATGDVMAHTEVGAQTVSAAHFVLVQRASRAPLGQQEELNVPP